MAAQPSSPPISLPSSPSQKPEAPLSLDLSSITPLITPSPPSNTLLITNLNNPHTFTPATLQSLYSILSDPTPLNSFSPLPSLRRLIISYPTVAAAIETRQLLSTVTWPTSSTTHPSEEYEKENPRIYFGEPTPVYGEEDEEGRFLKAPSLGKLLFISPPPSPPAGWEVREEEPPNKDTVAEDLLKALSGLSNDHKTAENGGEGDAMDVDIDVEGQAGRDRRWLEGGEEARKARDRSGSVTTTVYHPRDHGGREDLPAVMVEDTCGDDTIEEAKGGVAVTKTARPPVELMGDV